MDAAGFVAGLEVDFFVVAFEVAVFFILYVFFGLKMNSGTKIEPIFETAKYF